MKKIFTTILESLKPNDKPSKVNEVDVSVDPLDIKNQDSSSTCECVTSNQKWLIAIILGIIFLIVSIPIIYNLTNTLLSKINIHTTNKKGLPTPFGLVLHTLIFIIIVRVLMH
jgi:hypothetical protein